jgi:hypothetical protein
LGGSATNPGQHELKETAGPVRPVRKIAVVTCGDAEHAHNIEGNAENNRLPGDARPERTQASQMHAKERKAPDPFDPAIVRNGTSLISDRHDAHAFLDHSCTIQSTQTTRIIAKKSTWDCNISVIGDLGRAASL